MIFNSNEFLFFFLPVTLTVYFLLNRYRLTLASKSWLVAASLFFYSWWDVRYLPLILASIAFNYALGTVLGKHPDGRRKGAILLFGAAANLALLGYYKYFNFFISNVNGLLDSGIPVQRIILPLGISFFTFTQIAYLVDSYKGTAREYDLLNYGLFVTFFPHLLAGPIIHHKDMMPQFASSRKKVLNYKNMATGLLLLSIGLFKKVVIADRLSMWANTGFGGDAPLNMLSAWYTSLSYTFQIYFDFSGYTDMALGASLMFNIKLPINFNSPYKALNIQDFWRRWHITLSRFLRDYIYIPLGGNKSGPNVTYVNLMVTFLLGGLWHGAGWTFILWGGLHGTAIVVHRIWHGHNIRMPKPLAWLLTFNFVNIAWVFFRAKTMQDAHRVLAGMFGLNGLMLPAGFKKLMDALSIKGVEYGNWRTIFDGTGDPSFFVAAALVFCLLARNSNETAARFTPDKKTLAFALLLTFIALTSMGKVYEFLYFNF